MDVTLNTERSLYVIHTGGYFSCLGFDVARDHAEHIAQMLNQPELACTAAEQGTLEGYAKYRRAIDAWGRSPKRAHTYFAPHTPAKARKALEACRLSGAKVRLMLGNTDTGIPWLDEHDVVGTIGRSCGPLKVPLLIEDGKDGGTAILCQRLLAIIDWQTGHFLFRHARFQVPVLSIAYVAELPDRPWQVSHEGTLAARFTTQARACAYMAFMLGASIEPRTFQ